MIKGKKKRGEGEKGRRERSLKGHSLSLAVNGSKVSG